MTVSPGHVTLIVDPDADTRDWYSGILTPIVSEIEYAEDGRDALAKAIGCLPGVVITETRLAFINGYTLCSMLRADPLTAGVPIVVVTADTTARDIERARASGADCVLAKPCLPEALMRSVAQGRDRSWPSDARAEGMPESSAGQGSNGDRLTAPPTGRARRLLVRDHRRFETSTPPLAPPVLRCPSCDQPLQYVRSHIGGVSAHLSEQWDYYACGGACGPFQYRQRTRKLRQVEWTSGLCRI